MQSGESGFPSLGAMSCFTIGVFRTIKEITLKFCIK